MEKQPKPLFEFWKDTATKDNVREYLLQSFREEAVRRLMTREDAVALADASELLVAAFDKMDEMFEPKRRGREPVNEAR